MVECSFKSADLVNGEALKQDEFIRYIESQTKDPIWKPVVKREAVACLASTTRKYGEIRKLLEAPEHNIRPEDCNIRFMAVVDCIFLKLITACPKEFWFDSKNCNAVQDFLEKCFEDEDNLPLLLSNGMT